MNKIVFNPSLTPTAVETYIIDTVNAYPERLIQLTATDFANAYHFSPSALSRFVKKYGFANYTELKLHVASQLWQPALNPAATPLLPTFSLTRQEVFLAEAILKAEKIYTFGLGISALPPQFLAISLNNNGIPAHFTSDFHNTLETLSTMTSRDLLIIFSRKLLSNEVNFLLSAAASLNVNFWYITTNATHPKNALHPHVLLPIPANSDRFELNVKTRNAMLNLVDQLIRYVASHYALSSETQQKRAHMEQIIREWKKSS